MPSSSLVEVEVEFEVEVGVIGSAIGFSYFFRWVGGWGGVEWLDKS